MKNYDYDLETMIFKTIRDQRNIFILFKLKG